jgi:uncharacterized protein DUF6529
MTTDRISLPTRSISKIIVPVAIGSAVAVGLGVYGGLHQPSGYSINIAGFSGTLAVKSWLVTTATVLAIVQLISALMMWGKIPGPSWAATLHRWSGRIAVLVTVPVVVHCLYALGFQTASPRVLIHSVLGCFFYGAFVVKMLLLRKEDLPGWVLPAIGGGVLAGLVGLWLTSALWFFTTFGVTF